MGFIIQQVDPLLTLVALEKTAFKNFGRDYTRQSEMFMYLLQIDAESQSPSRIQRKKVTFQYNKKD